MPFLSSDLRAVPAVAKTCFPICDVRDVAQAHIKALITKDAVGKRHIVYSDSWWMKQVALVLQKEFKPKGFHVPTIVAPNFLVWLNSFIDKKYKTVVSRLGKEYKFSNERVSQPRSNCSMIIETSNEAFVAF